MKIWQIPGPLFSAHLNALAALGKPATETRPSIALASGSLPAQKANSGSSPPATAGSRPLANISQGGLQPAMVAAGLFVVIGEPGPETGEVGRKAKYTGMHALQHFFASWCINRKVDGGQELPPKNVQG